MLQKGFDRDDNVLEVQKLCKASLKVLFMPNSIPQKLRKPPNHTELHSKSTTARTPN
jgi:hypothetical protein